MLLDNISQMMPCAAATEPCQAHRWIASQGRCDAYQALSRGLRRPLLQPTLSPVVDKLGQREGERISIGVTHTDAAMDAICHQMPPPLKDLARPSLLFQIKQLEDSLTSFSDSAKRNNRI